MSDLADLYRKPGATPAATARPAAVAVPTVQAREASMSLAARLEREIREGRVELPVLPRAAIEVQELIARDADVPSIVRAIEREPIVAAALIKYANAAVYAGFAFVSNAISVWILFLVYGIYFGLVEGAEKALVADLVRPEQRGTAYGLYNLAFGVTVLPASLLMGTIWDWKGPATAFLVSAAMGSVAAILLLVFVRGTTNKRIMLTNQA